jgi:hypothetical protein
MHQKTTFSLSLWMTPACVVRIRAVVRTDPGGSMLVPLFVFHACLSVALCEYTNILGQR